MQCIGTVFVQTLWNYALARVNSHKTVYGWLTDDAEWHRWRRYRRDASARPPLFAFGESLVLRGPSTTQTSSQAPRATNTAPTRQVTSSEVRPSTRVVLASDTPLNHKKHHEIAGAPRGLMSYAADPTSSCANLER